MIKLKPLLEDVNGYEFVGFHKQRRERGSPSDDIFVTGNNYGKTYFREILESLYHKDRDYAQAKGWLDFDWSNCYSDDYEDMEDTVADWLNDRGYRWIFVTANRPIGKSGMLGPGVYGWNTYKIYFRRDDVLHIFDDPEGADDIAYAYVYHIKNPPKWEVYQDD